jgi:hypothetical protein
MLAGLISAILGGTLTPYQATQQVAYAIWQQTNGTALANWCQAERQLNQFCDDHYIDGLYFGVG